MTDERIIAYLLEELPEAESEQFEDECFAQESWPTRINLVEEDLIDAYLRDELTQEQRQHFEQNYLTTEARQERVMMAAALLRHFEKCDAVSESFEGVSESLEDVKPNEGNWTRRFLAFWSGPSRTLRAATAFAVVALIACALWLALSRAPSPKTFASLTLAISLNNNRAEGAPAGKVTLPLNADALRISLKLPEQPASPARYRVELENDNGETTPLEIAGQEAQSVTVIIPAAQLARRQYALKLYAVNADGTEQRINGSYFFTVG